MRILLATDGSSYARHAARFLDSLLHTGASIHIELVAVQPPDSGTRAPSKRGGYRPAGGVGLDFGDPERWLDEAQAPLDRPGIQFERTIRTGDPAREVVDLVRRRLPDLVVAGAKGCGATPFFELGHVARALLQEISVPTLLVRKGGGGYSREQPSTRLAKPGAKPGRTGLRALLATIEASARKDLGWESFGALSLGDEELPVLPFPADRGYQPREVDREARRSDTDLLILDTGIGTSSAAGIPGSAARTTAWTAPCSVLILRNDRHPDPSGFEDRTERSGPQLRVAEPRL